MSLLGAGLAVRSATEGDFVALAPLLRAYVVELAIPPDTDTAEPVDLAADVNDFNVYWREEGRFAFVVEMDGVTAGFPLVRALGGNSWTMGEFFILGTYRRSGVGESSGSVAF
jgi:hypothetical protein